MRRRIQPKRFPASFKMWALTDGTFLSVFGDGTPVIDLNRSELEYIREDEEEKIQRVIVTVRRPKKIPPGRKT